MAYNLTSLRGTPVYTGAGKFGTGAMSGGVVTNAAADSFLSSTGANGGTITTGTIEGWVKCSDTGFRVAFGHSEWFWVGKDSSGNAQARYGGVTELQITSTTNINDNAWHHIALVFNAGAGSLYVDGSRVGTNATVGVTGPPATAVGFCVGGFGEAADTTTGFDWTGSVDEVRISTTARYTGTTYTVPTAAFTDNASDTAARALYHFEGNGTDAAQSVGGPVTISPTSTGILYSPYNWSVGSGVAETINSGAYLKTIITGSPSTLSLTFDMTNVSSPVPQISYRVDQGSWVDTPIAATVALTMPTGNTWTKRSLEVVVKSTSETVNRWNSPRNAAVKLTGIVTNSTTATAVAPTARALNVLVFGDSITEGVRTLNSSSTNDTDRNAARQGWAWNLAEALGAEVGVVGFGGTGLLGAGSGNVPALPTSYASLWAGAARSFTPQPDLVIINIGTNDGSTDTTSAMTGLLNSLLSATTARIVVLRPFNGTAQASFLQAAVAASSDPKRVSYVDTTGWWATADSSDSLHPYGYANVQAIAPLVASAARSALARGATWINVGGVAKAASIVRR